MILWISEIPVEKAEFKRLPSGFPLISHESEVHRIYRLEHATKIDTINMALNAVGSRIALSVEPLEGGSSKMS